MAKKTDALSELLAKKISKVEDKVKDAEEALVQVAAEIASYPIPEKGDKGDLGDRGERGVKGDKGDKGERGFPGKNGKDGRDGRDGLNGLDGQKGDKGDPGEKGEKGDKGEDGKTIVREVVSYRDGGGGSAQKVKNEINSELLNYTLTDGSRPFTGTVGGVTPVAASDLATKDYVDSAAGGDVSGPASSIDNAFARYDGITGKLIQNSQTTEDDSGNVIVAGTIGASNLSGTNTGDQNLFQTIAVSGQDDIVADSASDTLNVAAGDNVTLATNATTDTLTINATGDVTAAANMTDNAIVRGDGGAKGVQDSGILVDDSNNMTGVVDITSTGIIGGYGHNLPMVIYEDVKNNGTGGGTFTSGAWRTRDLTFTSYENDPNGFFSRNVNQFTLTSGSYYFQVAAPAFTVNNHQVGVYSVTDAGFILVGKSCRARANSFQHTDSLVYGPVVIDATKTFEIRHRCATTRTTNGFGVAASFGLVEVYTQVVIIRLND